MFKTMLILTIVLWAGGAVAGDKIDAARKTPQIDNVGSHDRVAELVEETKGALVYIITKRPHRSDPRRSASNFVYSAGSGFFINLEEGYVITNHHVVGGGGKDNVDLRLKLANGEEYRAKIVGSSEEVDVAVLQIADPDFDRDGLKELVFADKVSLGELVVALGAPFGLQETVTMGIVSGINRSGNNMVQTDAAINSGNSGGPLLNKHGKVVGINSMKLIGRGTDNTGFAVSANTAKIVADRIITQGYFKYGYLGVGLQELHTDMRDSFKIPQDVDGVLITEFTDEENPPEHLKVGDAIVAINGIEVATTAEAVAVVRFLKPGTKINIHLYRDGKEKTIKVLVKEYRKMGIPTVAGATAGVWGVTFQEQSRAENGERQLDHLLVKHNRNVRTDLAAGDMITAMDNIEIDSLEHFQAYLKGRTKVVLHIKRSGREFYVVMNK